MEQAIPMPSILKEAAETAVALAKGFSVTLRTLFRPTVTENYPDEPVRFETSAAMAQPTTPPPTTTT